MQGRVAYYVFEIRDKCMLELRAGTYLVEVQLAPRAALRV